MDRTGIKWSKEETILAFDLYCRTPFGKIHQNNPDIIALATLIGRTPGSVGYKMHNLAHLDPELKKRNITALAHGSKMDSEVFYEFCDDIAELSLQAQIIKDRMQKTDTREIIDYSEFEAIPPGEYKNQMMKTRIGQYYFRMSVLNSYGNRCCITGIQQPEMLIASHIKPWSVCDEKTERTNPRNGLCLNALHDKAFDKGLITIGLHYQIVMSEYLKESIMDEKTREWFFSYEGRIITLPDKFYPAKQFIEYHNDIIFRR